MAQVTPDTTQGVFGPEPSPSHIPKHFMGLPYMPIRPGVVDWGSIDRHICQSHGVYYGISVRSQILGTL